MKSSFRQSTFAILEYDHTVEVHEYKRGECRIEKFSNYSQAAEYVRLCVKNDDLYNKLLGEII